MTQKEFDNARFGRGDRIKIRNEEYLLAEVDFEFGIITVIVSMDDSHYKNIHFEDCELIKEKEYKILDCNGFEMQDHHSGRRRTLDEAERLVEALNKNGEYAPYTFKEI